MDQTTKSTTRPADSQSNYKNVLRALLDMIMTANPPVNTDQPTLPEDTRSDGPTPPATDAPQKNTRAWKVFRTVELMEGIMMCLNTCDILRAMKAMKAMRDTVIGSAKLQKHIGLLPDYDAHFLALPWADKDNRDRKDIPSSWHRDYKRVPTFHGFKYDNYQARYSCEYDGRYDNMECGMICDPRKLNHANFIISSGTSSLERLGARCRQLSVCQPPLRKAIIEYSCEHDGGVNVLHSPPHAIGVLRPGNGAYITIGDLCKAVLQTRKRHRQKCRKPKAKAKIVVEFRCSLTLRKADPIMMLRQDREHAIKHYYCQPQDWDEATEELLKEIYEEDDDGFTPCQLRREAGGEVDSALPNITWCEYL